MQTEHCVARFTRVESKWLTIQTRHGWQEPGFEEVLAVLAAVRSDRWGALLLLGARPNRGVLEAGCGAYLIEKGSFALEP